MDYQVKKSDGFVVKGKHNKQKRQFANKKKRQLFVSTLFTFTADPIKYEESKYTIYGLPIHVMNNNNEITRIIIPSNIVAMWMGYLGKVDKFCLFKYLLSTEYFETLVTSEIFRKMYNNHMKLAKVNDCCDFHPIMFYKGSNKQCPSCVNEKCSVISSYDDEDCYDVHRCDEY